MSADDARPAAPPLSEDDYQAISYFWHTRGDLSRWSEWREKQQTLPPKLVLAWNAYQSAREAVSAVVRALEYEVEDD